MKVNIPEMMKGMIGNKELVIKSVLKIIEDSEKISAGMNKMLSSEKTDGEKLQTLTKYTSKLAHNQSMMSVLLLVYVSGDNYSSDAASVGIKFGANPQDMIRSLFKNKMEGK